MRNVEWCPLSPRPPFDYAQGRPLPCRGAGKLSLGGGRGKEGRRRRPALEEGAGRCVYRFGILSIAVVEIENVASVGTVKQTEVAHRHPFVKGRMCDARSWRIGDRG